MRLKGLDLNLLVVLDALLKERSVSLAAASLQLGQSAVSSALSRLREHFSDDLLLRLNRQMVPTALALELEEPVRDLLQSMDSIVHAQPDFMPKNSHREFVVLCSDYVADTFMPKVIRRLAAEAPDAALAIRPLNGALSLATPAEDIARRGGHFQILPAEFCVPGEPRVHLFHEHYCCAVWRDNPHVGESLTYDGLRQLPQIAMQFSDSSPDAIEARPLILSGLNRPTRATADQFLLALELVVGTPYLAMIPSRLARKWESMLNLRVFELPEAVGRIEFDAALQCDEGQMDDPALRWFRDVIVETACEH